MAAQILSCRVLLYLVSKELHSLLHVVFGRSSQECKISTRASASKTAVEYAAPILEVVCI